MTETIIVEPRYTHSVGPDYWGEIEWSWIHGHSNTVAATTDPEVIQRRKEFWKSYIHELPCNFCVGNATTLRNTKFPMTDLVVSAPGPLAYYWWAFHNYKRVEQGKPPMTWRAYQDKYGFYSPPYPEVTSWDGQYALWGDTPQPQPQPQPQPTHKGKHHHCLNCQRHSWATNIALVILIVILVTLTGLIVYWVFLKGYGAVKSRLRREQVQHPQRV